MSINLLDLATGFAVAFAALLVAVLVFLLLREARKNSKSPGLDVILDALKPFALKAIFGAETMALRAYDEVGEALAGVDKKKLADSLYAALPGTIWIIGRPFPVGWIKTFVTKERWEQLVQDVFDEVQREVLSNETWLREQVDALTGGALPAGGRGG